MKPKALCSLLPRLLWQLRRPPTDLVLNLVDKQSRKALCTVRRVRIGCGFTRRERLVRAAPVLLLVDRSVDASDSSVEARLFENLRSCGQRSSCRWVWQLGLVAETYTRDNPILSTVSDSSS
jgi:hypothetical protein